MSEQGEITPDPENEGEGKEKGDAAPNKEADALRTGMMAERDKRQASEARESAALQESAELRGKLSALEEGASRQAPGETTFSRSQLDSAVADGRINQDEADRIYHKQMVREITEDVTAKVTETTTVNAVGAEIRKYQDALPVLSVRGSDEFAKVANEFAWMVSNGLPNNLNTELAAMRSVFGDSTKLNADKGKKVLPTHEETGGSAQEESGGTKDGWPKDIKAPVRAYYTDLINKGIVVDIAAAKKELNYKPKHEPRHAK